MINAMRRIAKAAWDFFIFRTPPVRTQQGGNNKVERQVLWNRVYFEGRSLFFASASTR
jgi:hypothetical protein